MDKGFIILLRCVYFANLATAGIIAVLFEMLSLEPGQLTCNEEASYWFGICGIGLLLICIPVALKLMSFKRIKAAVKESTQAYQTWSLMRLALLEVPLLFNTLAYYLLGCEPKFGYMALMIVVAHLFVWPSLDKMNYERELNYDQEEA